MRTSLFTKLCFLAAIIVAISVDASRAGELNNNEVEFTGTISSIVPNGEGFGTLFVRFDDFDLRVLVNSRTNLEDEDGQEIEMSELAVGDAVKTKGKFSSGGIIASEIRLLAKAGNNFQLWGRVTSLQVSSGSALVSLLGITLVVNSDTKIESDGARVPLSDLRVGMLVQAEGRIVEGVWTAATMKVLSESRRRDEVRFEGIVREVRLDLIRVEVDGVPGGVTTVLLTSNTRTVGDLQAGVVVQVAGALNPDLSVTTREVRVLQVLEIKPEERKLKVGERAHFILKLRETAAGDVVVSLTSSDTSVLALSQNSVTIPKGAKTADFSATGLKTGTAVIIAAVLGQRATAQVKVGEVSEEENESPRGEARIAFAPDKIKMGLNDTRDVVLLIKPPQRSPVPVQFTVKNNLVSVTAARDFSSGAASLKVTIQSGSREGTDSVVATLPAALGGGKAELLVEVAARDDEGQREKAEIDFRPEEIRLSVGETRSVNLRSSRSFDRPVSVSITSGGAIVQAPSSVVIPAGSKSVQVPVAGRSEGEITLTATLPSDLGGDTAKLAVTVRGRDGQERTEIDFRPNEVKLTVGETRNVNLLSNRSFERDVTVGIAGGGAIAEAPSSVVIPAGSRSVLVAVSGKAVGKVNLIATLPASLGGDNAELEVEVRERR